MQDDAQLSERQLIEMVTLAGEFCIYIEKSETFNKEEIWEFLSKISPVLYLHGLLYPATAEPEDEGNERFVTEEAWENVFNNLRNKFGKDDEFTFIDYYSGDTAESLRGSLAELYADVYQDLKDFVYLVTKNIVVARKFASYNIKQLFNENWGRKLLQAQMILHSRVLASKGADEYDDLY